MLTDVKLPDGDGIEILRHVKAASPETAVIVMTAYGTTEIGGGRPEARGRRLPPQALRRRRAARSSSATRSRSRSCARRTCCLKAEFGPATASTASSASRRPWPRSSSMVRSVAPTSSTVLITGESGTGKELVARAIHALSPARTGPSSRSTAAPCPETLLESELFGHVKGAFTDAHQSKKGLFEAAHRGTLFLDEIGETPPAMQVKLLRALQERRIRRVGGTDGDRGRRARDRGDQPPRSRRSSRRSASARTSTTACT